MTSSSDVWSTTLTFTSPTDASEAAHQLNMCDGLFAEAIEPTVVHVEADPGLDDTPSGDELDHAVRDALGAAGVSYTPLI